MQLRNVSAGDWVERTRVARSGATMYARRQLRCKASVTESRNSRLNFKGFFFHAPFLQDSLTESYMRGPSQIFTYLKMYARELKEVEQFKYLGSMLIRDGYCTRKIKMRIAIAKEAFNTLDKHA